MTWSFGSDGVIRGSDPNGHPVHARPEKFTDPDAFIARMVGASGEVQLTFPDVGNEGDVIDPRGVIS